MNEQAYLILILDIQRRLVYRLQLEIENKLH